MSIVDKLEHKLDNRDPISRAEAIRQLGAMVEAGEAPVGAELDEVNLHFHTFFSYNANMWSPSRIAWEARKYGLKAAGIVDFDVLDGVGEFLSAAETPGIDLRACAALETRVFLSEYSDKVMTSPNEPGVTYFMAGGCWKKPDPGSEPGLVLQKMRDMARDRNLSVMTRVNDFLDAVRLDYEHDVLPLTPSGNATERHMLAAYDDKARNVFLDPAKLALFWAAKLGVSESAAAELLEDTPKLHEKMRSALMKFGGVGYVPPTADTFPTIESVVGMIVGMGALPTATWLDGTTDGEADIEALLGVLASKGVVAMNIVPERNWNIKDPEEKRIKVENLGKAVRAAKAIDFPLCVGTEMNKAGLPFVDNFSAPELAPFAKDFIDGAYFFWGHTFLAKNAGMGYYSPWAEANLDSRKAKNEFYTKAGELAEPKMVRKMAAEKLWDMHNLSAAGVLRMLRGQE